jgi:hypothetical protein
MRTEVLRRTTNYARNSETRKIVHRTVDILISCSVTPEFSIQKGLFRCPSFLLQTLKCFKLDAMDFLSTSKFVVQYHLPICCSQRLVKWNKPHRQGRNICVCVCVCVCVQWQDGILRLIICKLKVKQYHYRPLDRPCGLQEVEALRF